MAAMPPGRKKTAPVLPRPKFRIPLSAAVGIVLLAYLARSAIRGFDFRPDLPEDAIVLVAFVVVLLAVAVARHMEHGGTDSGDDTESPNSENCEQRRGDARGDDSADDLS
jgi:hypothetical protein